MRDPDSITRGAVQTESGTNSNLRHAQREEQFRTDSGSEFQVKDKQRIFFFIFYRSVEAGKQNKSVPACLFCSRRLHVRIRIMTMDNLPFAETKDLKLNIK